MSQIAKFGTVQLVANKVTEQTFDRNTLRLTASPDGQRDAERGLVKAVYSTFHSGGLRPDIVFGVWQRDMDKFRYTQGLITHIPFGLYLPYKLKQTRLAFSVDQADALNQRSHMVAHKGNFWVCAVIKSLVRETAYQTDPTPVVATTSGLPTFTNYSAIASDGTYVFVGLYGTPNANDGTIRAIWQTADPTATPVVFTGWDTTGGSAANLTHRCYGFTYVRDFNFYIAYGLDLADATPPANAFAGLYYGTQTSVTGKLLDSGGNAIALAEGGCFIGTMPSNPHRIIMLVPLGTELATTTLPRLLAYCDITNNAGVPQGVVSYPNTESDSVIHAAPFLGGVAYLADPLNGDKSVGEPLNYLLASSCKMIDSNNIVRDLQLPKSNGGNPIAGQYLKTRGRFLICHCVYIDNTDEIDLVWTPDGTWHSLSALYASYAPSSTNWRIYGVPPAEFAISPYQHYSYHVSSDSADSAGHMNFDYQYTPPNLLDNPLLTHTTFTKQSGASLAIDTLYHDRGGPVEANKSLLLVKYLSGFISALDGAYGAMGFNQFPDDFGSAALNASHTFNSAFEEFQSAGAAPFRSTRDRIVLQNTSSVDSAITPNGLPILTMQVVKWPKLSEWTLDLDLDETLKLNGYQDWTALKSALKTLENAKDGGSANPAQRFMLGDDDVLATLEQYVATSDVPMIGQPTERDMTPTVVIREAPGVSH